MFNVSPARSVVLLSLLGASMCAAAQTTSQTAPQTPSTPQARVVALTSGECVPVTEGDIVTFEWAPALEHSSANLSNFHLVFTRLVNGQIARVGDHVTLDLYPVRGTGKPVRNELPTPINGIYEMSFRVYLRGMPSGEYDLTEARPETSPQETAAGTTPAMTNSPLRYHFCLSVDAPSASRRGP